MSYTNEGKDSQSYVALLHWIRNTYPATASAPMPGAPITIDALHDHVLNLYLTAARSVKDNMDPDVQVGLGVLSYNSRDFDRAIDCFRAALSVRPVRYE